MPPAWEQPNETPPKVDIQPEPAPVEDLQPEETTPVEEPGFQEVESASETIAEPEPIPFEPLEIPEPPPVNTPRRKSESAKEERVPVEKSMQAKQEVLQFEPVNRGRFEKSEPTIVEGEDLDVPTYLRKKIKVK
jgi:cell division protein FtsZ